MKVRRLVAAIVAVLVILIALEALLRLSTLIPISWPSTPYIPDAEMGFKLRPAGITDADGFKNPHSDAEPAPARRKKPGTVAFVGDSFPFGTYPAEAVYPALVIADLGAEGTTAMRAVNLGIPGAGPDTYLRVMRTYLPRLEPVAVVVTIYLGNDIEQSDPSYPTKLWLGFIGNYPDPLSTDPDDLMLVGAAGKLFRLAERAWQARFRPSDSAAPDETGRQSPMFGDGLLSRIRWNELQASRITPDRHIARGYAGLSALLNSMAAFARDHGTKFLVVLAPSRIEIDADARNQTIVQHGGDPAGFDAALPARRVGEALSMLGIPYVDLTSALAAAGAEHVYNQGDIHWNRRGNAIAAEAIAAALKPLIAAP